MCCHGTCHTSLAFTELICVKSLSLHELYPLLNVGALLAIVRLGRYCVLFTRVCLERLAIVMLAEFICLVSGRMKTANIAFIVETCNDNKLCLVDFMSF